MPLSIDNRPQMTGIIILFTGVALLAFTFVNAFLFLQEPLGILAAGDLGRVFGEALAPLIQACVRLMYLGIMGWIGSLLTIRGIPLVTHKYVQVQTPEKLAVTQAKPISQTAKTVKPAPKPAQPHPTTEPTPQPQISTEQAHESSSKVAQKEPKAILIPPEHQREE